MDISLGVTDVAASYRDIDRAHPALRLLSGLRSILFPYTADQP